MFIITTLYLFLICLFIYLLILPSLEEMNFKINLFIPQILYCQFLFLMQEMP